MTVPHLFRQAAALAAAGPRVDPRAVLALRSDWNAVVPKVDATGCAQQIEDRLQLAESYCNRAEHEVVISGAEVQLAGACLSIAGAITARDLSQKTLTLSQQLNRLPQQRVHQLTFTATEVALAVTGLLVAASTNRLKAETATAARQLADEFNALLGPTAEL